MPTYVITSPDGRKFRVTGGGTKEQALAHIQSQYQAPSSVPEKPDLKTQNPGEYDPNSPEYQAKYGATSASSKSWMSPTLSNFMAGAGKSVVDTGRGFQQIAAEAGGRLGLAPAGRAQQLRAEQADVNQRDAALMDTGAGLAGNVSGLVAQTVLPGLGVAGVAKNVVGGARIAQAALSATNPSTLMGAATLGALQGASRPLEGDESRAASAAVGGLLGAGGSLAAKAVGRIAQPIKQQLPASAKRSVEILQKAGVPLDAQNRTGSRALAVVKQGLSGNAYTAGAQAAAVERQTKGFTRAVLRTIGVKADEATPEVLGAARDRIGSVFDDVGARHRIAFDKPLRDTLDELSQRASRSLPTADNQITRQIQNIQARAFENADELPAGVYQSFKTEIDGLMRQPGVSPFAVELRKTLDDALQRATKGTPDFERLVQARQHYGRLLKLTDATDESGAITPAKLWQQFNTKGNRGQAKWGKGDRELVRLAAAGKRILTDKRPNSGTPERLAAQVAIPGIVYAGTQAATGDPVEAAKYAAIAYAGPKVLQKALNSSGRLGNYLSGGLTSRGVRNVLEAPNRNALIGLSRQAPVGVAFAPEKKDRAKSSAR